MSEYEKKMKKHNDETFCVKKCQFGLLHKADNDEGWDCWLFESQTVAAMSSIELHSDEWELFEETKEVCWFRRKGK